MLLRVSILQITAARPARRSRTPAGSGTIDVDVPGPSIGVSMYACNSPSGSRRMPMISPALFDVVGALESPTGRRRIDQVIQVLVHALRQK